MKAILIDPVDLRISSVEISGNRTLPDIYEHMHCRTVAVAGQIGKLRDHDVIVDDEGLFKDNQRYFAIKGITQPLAGIGLILRATRGGRWDDCRIQVDEVAELVRFLSGREVVEGMAMAEQERNVFFDECHKRGIVVYDHRPWRQRGGKLAKDGSMSGEVDDGL